MELIQHSQTLLHDDDIDAAIAVLKSGVINDSDITTTFERQFADYIGASWGRATSTGTLSLYLALKTLDVKAGDEVIFSSYVCDDVVSAVRFTGAVPRLADICLDDFNLDPHDVARKVTKRTRAIICPHMFGMPARLRELLQLEIPVIEDCAHSVGAMYRGRRAGTWGALACFSFHALKILTTGEGGMVLTSASELWQRLEHFDKPDLDAGEFAMTFHLSNILAAIGLSQLRHFEPALKRRREIAEVYNQGFKGLNLGLPEQESSERTSSCLRYCVLVPDKLSLDDVHRTFEEQGIIVRRPVKRALHTIRGLESDFCPNAQYAYDHVLSLPAHLHMTPEALSRVIQAARHIFR